MSHATSEAMQDIDEKMNHIQISSTADLIAGWVDCASSTFKFEPSKMKARLNHTMNLFSLKKVFQNLEEFICDGFNLKHRPASSRCRIMFGRKEPVYSCHDCGANSSKVMCESCFQESAHRDHKFESRVSENGGYCDCGDPESWKSSISCIIHIQDTQPSDLLPEDVTQRAKVAFEAVLEYAFMELQSEADEYCVVLFRSDIVSKDLGDFCVHKIPQVFACNPQGLVVSSSSYEQCNEIKSKLEEFNPIIEDYKVVCNRILALNLLDWLHNFASKYQELRAVLAQLALETSMFHKIVTRDHCLWQASRLAWLNLIKSTLVVSEECKITLAGNVVDNYDSLVMNLMNSGYPYHHSVLSLSPHLFKTRSQRLMLNHDLLLELVSAFISQNFRCGKISVTKESLSRTEFIIVDLKMFLRSKPKEEDAWTDKLRDSFLRGVSLYLELLSGIQLDKDINKKLANDLHDLLCPITNLIVDWCTSDSIVFEEVFQNVLKLAFKINDNVGTQIREIAGHKTSVKVFKNQKSSTVIPLTRFLASLFMNIESSFDLIHRTVTMYDNRLVMEMVEPVLRVQGAIAQKLISRDQSYPYETTNRHEMMDKDVLLLQVGAALYDSDKFLISLLDKFNLLDWAQNDYETCTTLDGFLELVVKMIKERYVIGVSEVTKERCLRWKIFLRMCTAVSRSLSEIESGVPKNIYDEKIAKDFVNEIGTTTKMTGPNRFCFDPCKLKVFMDSEMKLKLPRFTKNLEFLLNILQCDVMIHIIKTVLSHRIGHQITHSNLCNVLGIVKLALQEQESGYYSEFFSFTKRADKHQIFELLEKLEKTYITSDVRFRDLMANMLDKYKTAAASTKNHAREN